MSTPLLDKIRHLLREAKAKAAANGRDKREVKVQHALNALHQDDKTPPKKLIWPGVRAARMQSESGGLPGVLDGVNPGAGWCLKMVRLCYGIGASADSASHAWDLASRKHRETNAAVIPRGYPVFWSGGSHGFGHIAVSAGGGFCWSTDIRRTGFFDKVPITEIHDRWGLTLLGWTEDLNGEPVPATA